MSGKNLPNTMDFIAQPSESDNLEQKAAAGPNPISQLANIDGPSVCTSARIVGGISQA